MLHDIGKIGVNDAILNKTSALTGEDFRQIKEHPMFGVAILAPLKFLEDTSQVVLHHHEKWDVSGYPSGLQFDPFVVEAFLLTCC